MMGKRGEYDGCCDVLISADIAIIKGKISYKNRAKAENDYQNL